MIDDDMPKFRDSREKKEYIKLATKRNGTLLFI